MACVTQTEEGTEGATERHSIEIELRPGKTSERGEQCVIALCIRDEKEAIIMINLSLNLAIFPCHCPLLHLHLPKDSSGFRMASQPPPAREGMTSDMTPESPEIVEFATRMYDAARAGDGS